MSAVITSPADLVNVSLRKIGYRLRVANLLDGSEASSFALDIYGQTRDQLLREGQWDFAQRQALGTLLRSAPAAGYSAGTPWSVTTYPLYPYKYEYAYPDDCLKVRSVRPLPGALFDPAPTATLFTVANENIASTTYRRSILANIANALIVYTGQVTTPSQWPVDFVETFAAALARRLAPNLASMDVVKIESQDEALEMAQAAQG